MRLNNIAEQHPLYLNPFHPFSSHLKTCPVRYADNSAPEIALPIPIFLRHFEESINNN